MHDVGMVPKGHGWLVARLSVYILVAFNRLARNLRGSGGLALKRNRSKGEVPFGRYTGQRARTVSIGRRLMF